MPKDTPEPGYFFVVGYGFAAGTSDIERLYLACFDEARTPGSIREAGTAAAGSMDRKALAGLRADLDRLRDRKRRLYRDDPEIALHAQPVLIVEASYEGWKTDGKVENAAALRRSAHQDDALVFSVWEMPADRVAQRRHAFARLQEIGEMLKPRDPRKSRGSMADRRRSAS